MARGTITKRGKESWRLKYDIAPDPISGERRTKYATFKGSKRDAQKELAKLIAQAEDGIDIAPDSLTVKAFLEHWLTDTLKPSVRTRTYEGYETIVRKHLIPSLGRYKLKGLTALHIQAYYADKARSGRRDGKGGLAPQTIIHHHRTLFQALKHAHHARIITFNPAEAVKPPKAQREEITVISHNELKTLLESLKGKRFHKIVFMAACTGMRRSEILGLRWVDIDLKAGHLTVNQTLEQTQEHGIKVAPPKTKASRRRITLPPSAIAMLMKWQAKQNEEHLRLGVGKDNERLVFTRQDCEAYSPRSVSKEFEKVISGMEIPRITFHGLRHTHITHLLWNNVHIKAVSARAGHSSVSTTLDIYGHLIDGIEAGVADVVEGWFAGAIED